MQPVAFYADIEYALAIELSFKLIILYSEDVTFRFAFYHNQSHTLSSTSIGKSLSSMQEKSLISFYISSSSHHIGTSTPNKNIMQTLLHEVDMTKMDNSDNSKVHFARIALYRIFKSAVSPS